MHRQDLELALGRLSRHMRAVREPSESSLQGFSQDRTRAADDTVYMHKPDGTLLLHERPLPCWKRLSTVRVLGCVLSC